MPGLDPVPRFPLPLAVNTTIQNGQAVLAGLSARQSSLPVWKRAPTLKELMLLWAVTALIFAGIVSALRSYGPEVDAFGDTHSYAQIARAIRTWDFAGLQVKQFWGVSYSAAALSKLTGLPDEASVVTISAASSLLALLFAYRLWGGWIAFFSLTLNFDWYQRSFLGGSEPLFVALLFASFLFIRKERWLWAALLASLATVTRPLGIFLLLGIGLVLLWRRDWRRFAGATFLGIAIGALYMLPLQFYVHDALATVHSYGGAQAGATAPLFGIPFHAIIVGTLRYPAPWSNLLLTFGWILFVLAGIVAMLATRDFREYARAHPAEVIFAALYLIAIYSYNLPVWARAAFPRFAIPILPFVFLALGRWLPEDRRLSWILAILCSVLAACSAVGIHEVLTRLRG